jgi:hypothetical protein
MFAGWAEFPPEERLARSVNTMKILPDYMKRMPGMSLDFRSNGGRENRHPFGWIFLRPNRQIALNTVRDHAATSPDTLSNLNDCYRSGLDFCRRWRKPFRTDFM